MKERAPSSSGREQLSETSSIIPYTWDIRHALRERRFRRSTHPNYNKLIKDDNRLSWEAHFNLAEAPKNRPKKIHLFSDKPKDIVEINRRIIKYIRILYTLLRAKGRNKDIVSVISVLMQNISMLVLTLRQPNEDVDTIQQIEYAGTAYLASAFLEYHLEEIIARAPAYCRNNVIKLRQYKAYAVHSKANLYVGYLDKTPYAKFLATRLEESYLFLLQRTPDDDIFHLTRYRLFHLFYNAVFQTSLQINKIVIHCEDKVVHSVLIDNMAQIYIPRCFQFNLMHETYTPDTLFTILHDGDSQAIPVMQNYLFLINALSILTSHVLNKGNPEDLRKTLHRMYGDIQKLHHDIAHYFLNIAHNADYKGISHADIIDNVYLDHQCKIRVANVDLIPKIASSKAKRIFTLISATHLLAETITCIKSLLVGKPYTNILTTMLSDYALGVPIFAMSYEDTYVPSSVEKEDLDKTLELTDEEQPVFHASLIYPATAAAGAEAHIPSTEEDTERSGDEEVWIDLSALSPEECELAEKLIAETNKDLGK